MAVSTAIANSFKTEILTGIHNFTLSTGDVFKVALYTSSATYGASTTAYSSTNEITNTSGSAYTAGGATLTNVTPTLSGSTAVVDFQDVSWTTASFTANGCMIYNSSKANRTVSTHFFGGDQTVSAGTFTIVWPTPDASNAIIRIA